MTTEDNQVEVVAKLVYRAMRTAAGIDCPPEWVPYGNSLMQDTARDSAKEIIKNFGKEPAPQIPTVELVVTVLKALRGQSYCGADRIWAEAYVRSLSHPGITIGVTTFWYNAISSYPWGMQTKGGEPTHCGDMSALIGACKAQHVYITDASFRAILALGPTT